MARGFTLIEMLISIVVLAILLAAAVPSFRGSSEKAKMQRLAEELQGFFIQTKSEAVLRNQNLYLHFVQDGTPTGGEWALVTNTSSATPSDRHAAKSNALMYLEGDPFKGISTSSSILNMEFESVNGKPNQTGNIKFSLKEGKLLDLKFQQFTGRFRICGGHYGYPECE